MSRLGKTSVSETQNTRESNNTRGAKQKHSLKYEVLKKQADEPDQEGKYSNRTGKAAGLRLCPQSGCNSKGKGHKRQNLPAARLQAVPQQKRVKVTQVRICLSLTAYPNTNRTRASLPCIA